MLRLADAIGNILELVDLQGRSSHLQVCSAFVVEVWGTVIGIVPVLRVTVLVVSVVTIKVVLLRCLLRALQVIAVVVTGVANGTKLILSRVGT